MKKMQEAVINRINFLCNQKNYSYYMLSCKSGMSLTTLMNIMDGNSKNPGMLSVYKICRGLEISLHDFFDDDVFNELENEIED